MIKLRALRKMLLSVLLICAVTLCGCSNGKSASETEKPTDEIMNGLQPENVPPADMEASELDTNSDVMNKARSTISAELHGDYNFWNVKQLNYSERDFWDMSSNQGSGCMLGDLIYYTQIVNPTEIGCVIGQPINEYMADLVTEQNVFWTMSGFEFDKWCDVNENRTVKYRNYDCTAYETEALDGVNWTFMVHKYTYAINNDESTEKTYFNILGLSEFMGDWLTMEITGNYLTAGDENLESYKEIIGEFAEIYGWQEALGMKRAECAEFLMGLSA